MRPRCLFPTPSWLPFSIKSGAGTGLPLYSGSGTNWEFVPLLFRPFQQLFDARRIPHLYELPQFSQGMLIGTDTGDDILAVPQKNIPPHLRRTRGNPRRVAQAAARMAG